MKETTGLSLGFFRGEELWFGSKHGRRQEGLRVQLSLIETGE